MAEALYRKYRPLTFDEVINQKAVKTVLQNALKTGQTSHAYLFTGPRGVGKTTVARILAKAVNCQGLLPDGNPCARCGNCRMIFEGTFLDLIEIDAASYTGVDNIRDIIDHVRFAPASGKYKVIIIDEVHMLSKAAFNALLKTLEEPPSHAIFVLATTEIQKVPATIISRTQRFDFREAALADLAEMLRGLMEKEKVKAGEGVVELVARAASGSFRDALSIFDQMKTLADGEITLEDAEEMLGLSRTEFHQRFFELLLSGQRREAVQFIRALGREGRDMFQFAGDFLEYLRLLLLVKTGGAQASADFGLGADAVKVLLDQASRAGANRILQIVRQMMLAAREMKHSPVPDLPLIAAAMELTVESVESNEPKAAPAAPSHHNDGAALDTGRVLAGWSDVLAQVKTYNHSLISTLRLGRVAAVDSQALTLAFPYSFHKETIEARKNKIVVEQVLENVFGAQLKIKAILERPTGENLVDEALKVLGSEGGS